MSHLSRIPLKKFKWFQGRNEWLGRELSQPEAAHRLVWLSEGCLEYHMTKFRSKYYGPQGNPEEKKLFLEFINSL